MTEQTETKLSDEDVERIAVRVKELLVGDFQKDLGKGVWGLAWRAFILFLLAAAAIGSGVLKLPDIWPK